MPNLLYINHLPYIFDKYILHLRQKSSYYLFIATIVNSP